MKGTLKKITCIYMVFALPLITYAQKDVTQFLGIPVDGNKTEMINKLKSKGFTINQNSKEVLDGEFNGTDVSLFIVTNNNKVWRIGVFDINNTDETNIKIRFNNLINQFAKNSKYSKEDDSTLAKYTIPEDEDISYKMSVENKRYQAIFYQKSLKFDSLIKELALLQNKDSLNNKEKEKYTSLISDAFDASLDSFNKQVWFMIEEDKGKYRIILFYENKYNRDNGEGL